MRRFDRRTILTVLASAVPFMAAARVRAAPQANQAPQANHAPFVAQAFAMRQQAIDSGDQAFGAVVVRNGEIVGFGPSRVVVKRDGTAHAEREAVRDAQARLGRKELPDCVIYSTSRPCSDCEQAAAQARIARMYVGAEARDAGAPRIAR